jgi:hypothetical protein
MSVSASGADCVGGGAHRNVSVKNLLEDRHVTSLCALNDADDRAGVSFARWVTLTLTAAKEASRRYIATVAQERKHLRKKEF